jgi:hypothetical protein
MFLLCASFFLSPAIGWASENPWRRPLASRNHYPLALLFISPSPERGDVLPKGVKSFSLNFGYSNIVTRDISQRESLFFDMEYLSSTFQFATGLGKGFEVAASLPIYTMYGGFLDPLISRLHETFGFANEFRSSVPNNRFQYHYRVDGESVLERSSGVSGLGDLTLHARRALLGDNATGIKVALHAAVKLPTGGKKRLSGSEGTDFGIGLAASLVGRSIGGYVNLGYFLPGDSEGLMPKNFATVVAAFDWRFRASWPNLAMVVQFEQYQSFLKSDLPVLNQSAQQMILGLRWKQSNRYYYEWRLAEDLNATTPDFTFGFQITINSPARGK